MTYRPTKKFTAAIAGISALALVLTACGSSSTSTTTSSTVAKPAARGRPAASGSEAAPAGRRPPTSDWCDTGQGELGDITGKR